MKEFLEVTEELKVPDGEVWFTWDNDRNGKRVLAIHNTTPAGVFKRASVRLDRSQVAELAKMLEKGYYVPMMPIREFKNEMEDDWADAVAERHEPTNLYQCPECGGLSDNLICTKCSKEEVV